MKLPAGYEISTDKSRLQIDIIHGFLSRSYWAAGIPMEVVKRSLDHSLCFGIYFHEKQAGFARVVSDYATFAYLADVFVLEAHRGLGLSKALMDIIMAHPDLQGLRRFCLGTRDAHKLYERYGFKVIQKPELFMEIKHDNLYLKS